MQKYGKLISVFLIIMMLGSCLSGCGAAAGTGAEGSTVSSTNTEADGKTGEEAQGNLPEIIARAKEDSNFNEEGYPLVNDTVKKTIMIRKPGNIGDVNEMETLRYIA